MEYYLDAFRKYAQFSGRASRPQYWWFALYNCLIFVILATIDMFIGSYSSGSGVLTAIYSLAVIVPSFALLCRRLHDTNRSGWWILIAFVPLIGGIWLLVLTLLPSTHVNKY